MNKRKILSTVRKIKRIDILDGKKRAERVSRRLLILLMAISILVLSLFLIHKEESICQTEAEEIEETVFIQAETNDVADTEIEQDKVKEYINSYGGRINDEYLASLRKYCDEETLKLVVAISVAETSMGKATDNHSNFYGYFYGGNRSYDPSYDEMSMVICRGISKYYSDVAVNRDRAIKYVGSHNVDMWIQNVDKAISKMQ